MQKPFEIFAQQANFTRYHQQQSGHYESFFQRANHPTRPLAFWIRYTIFSPKKRPQDALGEIWVIYFNGETGHHIAVKQEVLFSTCTFSPSAFFVQMAVVYLWLKTEYGRTAKSCITTNGFWLRSELV